MEFRDTLTLDSPRRTNDGYLAASVRAARVGIQEYSGREVDPDNKHGLRDKATVRIFRPEASVFDKDSLATLAHRPLTVNHPPEAVTADNWRKYAVGQVGDEIARDGDFIRVPIAVMDGTAIRAIEGGKNQLSCGYSCELVFGDGVTPTGEQYDAMQTNIKFNHLSVVDLARGGDKLKIGDSKPMKTIMIDGHSVEVSDAAEIAIKNVQAKLADAETKLTASQGEVAKLTTQVANDAAKIVTLEKQVADSAITPAKLRDAAAAYAKTVATAKGLGVTVTDGMDETAIKKAVVSAKIGDVAKDWTDAMIDTSFATLAASAPAGQVDTLRDGVKTVTSDADLMTDAAKARAQRFARYETAHTGKAN